MCVPCAEQTRPGPKRRKATAWRERRRISLANSKHELPWDRISTADSEGNRVYLYPAEIRGRWRIRREILSAALVLLFLALPWIRIQGHPAVLLDIPNRRFALFGIAFWAHEAPLLILVAGTVVACVALITAVFGRVWCGWACPQTVFVEMIFRPIERWIEGNALERRKLDESPMSAGKLWKKTLKWSAFAGVALIISHSFLAYFVGTEELGRMMQSSPFEHPLAFLAMFGMFAAVLFDYGWFREQLCVVLCPYGRFQSVLMDNRSQVVAYDSARGEPRRGTVKEHEGDCVNCYRCVQVCPTGIDIRRGVQMECIACTACIDACDDVMSRLHKPLGLIRYRRGKHLSGRIAAYGALVLLASGLLAFKIRTRQALDLTFVRAPEAPYQESGDGKVSNHFKLDVENQSFDELQLTLTLPQEFRDRGGTLVVSNLPTTIAPGKALRGDVFIQYPKSILSLGKGRTSIQATAKSASGEIVQGTQSEVPLVGPYR